MHQGCLSVSSAHTAYASLAMRVLSNSGQCHCRCGGHVDNMLTTPPTLHHTSYNMVLAHNNFIMSMVCIMAQGTDTLTAHSCHVAPAGMA